MRTELITCHHPPPFSTFLDSPLLANFWGCRGVKYAEIDKQGAWNLSINWKWGCSLAILGTDKYLVFTDSQKFNSAGCTVLHKRRGSKSTCVVTRCQICAGKLLILCQLYRSVIFGSTGFSAVENVALRVRRKRSRLCSCAKNPALKFPQARRGKRRG